jgi:hypothetical protein
VVVVVVVVVVLVLGGGGAGSLIVSHTVILKMLTFNMLMNYLTIRLAVLRC